MEVEPQWEDASTALLASRQSLENAQTALSLLHAKEGRKNQFKSQKERDQHLKSMIQGHETRIKDREGSEGAVEQALEEAKGELEQAQGKASELRRELDGRKETLQGLQGDLAKLKEDHRTQLEKRK